MRNVPLIWCCCFFGLIQLIHSTSIPSTFHFNSRTIHRCFLLLAQLMSFCNQTINMTSPLSIIFTPTSSSLSCCNITLIKPTLTNLSEEILINIRNLSEIIPSFQIFNENHQSIDFLNYSFFNRIFIQSNIIPLPLTFSLCQFNIQRFEIFITNISKGEITIFSIKWNEFVVVFQVHVYQINMVVR